jgi:hypothetical protein
MVLTALSRAVADGAGLPLHGTKAVPGLFPTTALGKQAAQRCKDEGLLRPLSALMREYHRPAAQAKAPAESYAITDKGFQYLLNQVSPRPVLEDLVRVLEERRAQVGELAAQVGQMQQGLEALRCSAEKVLRQVPQAAELAALHAAPTRNGTAAAAPEPDLLGHLERWHASGATEDCPLPELFRQAQAHCDGLTVGRFHDELRRLHDAGHLYLHPWTGPLYEIPEPAYALLVGHLVAYYASLKSGQ